ncbi:hypothetical protein MKW98_005036 [Papaver atlanticum]|uniref:WRKY domain-containing protein n=1 Tax=Papaver atlanticum TaxID=357466 RepID=A0AAD4XWX1_9MAGN|nr:hypothetical protein MKW98_005036 [Papaver atlanticum]
MEHNTRMRYLDQKQLILNELAEAKKLPERLSGTRIKSETVNEPQTTGSTESPGTGYRSFRSDCDSDVSGNSYEKRKLVPTWTEQVHVCEKTGLQGPIADGYSWRKYGQKDIRGSKHPRGYYRCAHKTAHGCLAMKQVQRSDEVTSIFNVTYRGKHTCFQAAHLVPNKPDQHYAKRLKKSQATIINFQSGCHVKTENSGTTQTLLRSPSTPIPCIEKESNNNIFSSMVPDNQYSMDSLFSCPYLLAPATSESSSFSPCRVQDLKTSDYDICEHTSTVTSAFDSSADVYFDFGYFDGLSF